MIDRDEDDSPPKVERWLLRATEEPDDLTAISVEPTR
jgi:hypothetical protein